MYQFSPASGVLVVQDQERLQPADVGYFGTSYNIIGRGACKWGLLGRIKALPYDEVRRLTLWSVSEVGEVTVFYRAETFSLAPGAERRWQYSGEREQPGCIITTTLGITNYGYQDRAKIDYYPKALHGEPVACVAAIERRTE